MISTSLVIEYLIRGERAVLGSEGVAPDEKEVAQMIGHVLKSVNMNYAGIGSRTYWSDAGALDPYV